MKLRINYILGEISIENADNCRKIRCIYHFQYPFVDTYCLIRIFDFKSKTIVIASHILGIVGGNRFLINNIIDYFKLNHENLYWINHDGLFSCYMTEKEEFMHTVFSYKKIFLFSHKEINIIEENKITRTSVETLTETSLEPVELWLGLDIVAENKFIKAREEKTLKLLYHYLKENIKYLYNKPEIIEVITQSCPGAILFYPNEDKKIEFINCTELLNRNDDYSKKIMIYVNKSFLNKEIVICVCIDNYDPFCTILNKDFLLNPTKINFSPIEKLVEYEIKSLDISEFNMSQYREKIRVANERLESLLQLYLEPKLKRLKVIFAQMESERAKLENSIGALFYYPEHDRCLFSYRWQLTSKHEKSAIPYVDTYNAETEMVICFSIYGRDSLSVCGVFPR